MPRERINRATVDDLAVNNLTVLGTVQVAGGAAAILALGTPTPSGSTPAAAASSSPAGDGSALTNLNASALATGTVAAGRLGSGTPSTSVFLRGDGTWAAPPQASAPVTKVAGRTGDVVIAAGDVAGLAPVAASGAYGDLSGRPTLPGLAGGKLSITGSGTVTPAGLATIASVVATLGQDASLAAARVTATWSGTTVTLKVWKPTSNLDGTPTAATTAAVVNWMAYGS